MIIAILDGFGDLPVNGKTPLSAAKKPNIDGYCKRGITGQLYPVGRGKIPGSDTSHLTIFGYDPKEYYCGRGPLEALGCGIELKEGDIAFRANLATLSDSILVDRRAGRIEEGGEELAKALDGIEIGDIKVMVRHSVQHRCAVVFRGEGLSPNITDTDPHTVMPSKILISSPTDGSEASKRTAEIVNQFTKEAIKILKEHPVNKKRKGKLPANCILLRGAGSYKEVPSVKSRFGVTGAAVAGGALYKGIAKYIGMDIINVKGASGTYNTDLKAKVDAILKAKADIKFLHIKATDSASHDGDFEKKQKMIEKIDYAIKPLLKEKNLILTGDHTTSVALKRHTSFPVPILVGGENIRRDKVEKFDEFSVMNGGLGSMEGKHLMPLMLDLLDKLEMYGT